MIDIILKSITIAFGIVAIGYCTNIALAQISPSTSQPSTLLSPTSTEQPAVVDSASAENTSALAVNSTIIGIPPSPTIVGPSSLVASPITSEATGTNSTE